VAHSLDRAVLLRLIQKTLEDDILTMARGKLHPINRHGLSRTVRDRAGGRIVTT